ncbi:molybdopterin-dependent oxidoreductase [Streptomyces mirabilis]|uniref:molybdopterin-dependent oxidoreductase n=1 Tax=Streptomyces mirabilis TaxID=68239 RepID=UPI0035D8EA4F
MGGDHPGAPGSTPTAPRRVPPGQRHVHGWPVSHYGPVPRFRPERWNLRVFGATLAWAEYGYAANLRLRDFTAPETLLATHHNGELLTAEHGFPLRLVVPHLYGYKSPKWLRGIEYLTEDRRGFWEARGYHNVGDPWKEQRYSHQEREGEGPAL